MRRLSEKVRVSRWCQKGNVAKRCIRTSRRASLQDMGGNGAEGRARTADTALFRRVLYQLSYLGILCQMNDCLFLVVNGTGQSLRSWSGGQLPFWLTCVSVQNASSTALQIIAKNGR